MMGISSWVNHRIPLSGIRWIKGSHVSVLERLGAHSLVVVRARAQGGVSLLGKMLLKSKESMLAGERLSKSSFLKSNFIFILVWVLVCVRPEENSVAFFSSTLPGFQDGVRSLGLYDRCLTC